MTAAIAFPLPDPTDGLPPNLVEALKISGLPWHREHTYRLDCIIDRVQVRGERFNAPKDMVDRYRAAMAGGTIFPPIVVTLDGRLADGNTRTAAAAGQGRPDYPAVVLDVDWRTATEDERRRVHLLGAQLNQQNGLPLDRDAQIGATEAALAAGWTSEAIGRFFGVKATKVSALRREAAAKARIAATGANGDRLNATQLRALGGASTLHDEPFRRLVDLARDASLSSGDIKAAAAKAKEARSEAEALAALDAERVEKAPQIAAVATTGRIIKPQPSQRMRMLVGQMLRPEWTGLPVMLMEPDVERACDYVGKLREVIELLESVIEVQPLPEGGCPGEDV